MISIPHLEVEPCRDFVLSLIPGEHGLLLGDYDLLLGHQVIKRVHKTPVKVSLAGDGVIMNIRVLLVFLLSF